MLTQVQAKFFLPPSLLFSPPYWNVKPGNIFPIGVYIALYLYLKYCLYPPTIPLHRDFLHKETFALSAYNYSEIQFRAKPIAAKAVTDLPWHRESVGTYVYVSCYAHNSYTMKHWSFFNSNSIVVVPIIFARTEYGLQLLLQRQPDTGREK